MSGWTEDRVWRAVDAWRWIPPGSQRPARAGFERAVTPGSSQLTYAYGLHARGGPSAEVVLDELRVEVERLGGTGVSVRVLAGSSPHDLSGRLVRRGYQVAEEA